MKVLLINGSPHKEGNTFIALLEVAKTLEANGIETEIVSIGAKAVHVEKVLIKCLQILKSLDNFLTTELLRLLKRSEIS